MNVRTRVAAATVLLAVVGWPKEAILGTYGSYRLTQKGWSLAKEISVGYMSDHQHEADVYRERQQAIEARLKPKVALYDGWYQRVFVEKHPYGGWLDALDRERATPTDWDYKSRLPAPTTTPPPEPKPGEMPAPIEPYDGGRETDLYLHMKAAAPPIAHARALVGFALAEAALGDTPALRLARPEPNTTLATYLERAARGDSFWGQGVLLARLVFQARGQEAALAAVAADAKQAADLRALAAVMGAALAHRPLSDGDWALVAAAKSDRRTTWTWVLATCPTAQAAAVEAQLQKLLPLSDEGRSYFYDEFILGKRR